MDYFEILKLALAAIWAHKLRSALTLLGVVIGIMGMVVVVSLIEGFNVYIDEKITGIGTKVISVNRFDMADFRDTDAFAAAARRKKKITLDDYEYIRERAVLLGKLGVKAPSASLEVKRGKEVMEGVPVFGTMAVMGDIENVEVAEGRYFSASEDGAAKRVAVVGADVARQLVPYDSALDKEIQIGGLPYRVVGVAAAKGSVFGESQDNFISIPLNTYLRDFGDTVLQQGLSIVATSKSDQTFDEAVEEIRFLMRTKHHLKADEEDNFGIQTPDAIAGLRDRIFGPIFIAAVVVPSIALLVGAIVIMNIMLVSVTERTKEIGIRKAIGARARDILMQFLIEAGTLSFIGGAVGIILAWIAGQIITRIFFPTHLSVKAVVVALVVSAAVGMLAGSLPALKAARLNPVEALQAD